MQLILAGKIESYFCKYLVYKCNNNIKKTFNDLVFRDDSRILEGFTRIIFFMILKENLPQSILRDSDRLVLNILVGDEGRRLILLSTWERGGWRKQEFFSPLHCLFHVCMH